MESVYLAQGCKKGSFNSLEIKLEIVPEHYHALARVSTKIKSHIFTGKPLSCLIHTWSVLMGRRPSLGGLYPSWPNRDLSANENSNSEGVTL